MFVASRCLPGVPSWTCALLVALGVTCVALPPAPAAAIERRSDLTDLSLQELMDVEVTSVLRKPERRSQSAAAVYVLTSDDMRRAGVLTIPDALRLVPGVQVARIDANKWAIGIRGFANRLSRSVLVLIDGRSVYSPLFAGTYWEVQDTLLEDVDRIEVVRGPGGSVWGANAVNGVINIITKSAEHTQGLYVMGGGGNEERGFGGIRYGGKLGEHFYWRAYAKYFDRDAGFNPDGPPSYDAWRASREGLRIDWDLTPRDRVTILGDVYDGDAGQQTPIATYEPPGQRVVYRDNELSGGSILARWRHVFSATSEASLQFYFDNTFRSEANFRERRNTYDVELQHRMQLPWRQELSWGLQYRGSAGKAPQVVDSVAFVPQSARDDLFTGFVQDDVTLLPELLRLTVGVKLEHNDYSAFEWQPSGRLMWTPHPRHALWAAISHAVRTPTRTDQDLAFDFFVPQSGDFVRVLGDDGVNPEHVTVDGAAVRTSAEIYVHAAALPAGTPVRYGFEQHGRTTELTVPTMRFTPVDYWSTAGLLTVNGWLYFGAAALVFFLKPRTRAASVFFTMGLTLTVYALTAVTLYHPLGRWVTVLHLAAQALFPATLVHLAVTFPVERRVIVDRPRLLLIPYALSAALAVASVRGFYAEPPDLRALYAVNLFIAAALVVLCTTTAYAYRERRSDRVRSQARVVGLGLVAATAVAVFAFVENTFGGGRFPMNFIAVTPVFFFVALGYAAIRHELFDIDRLVRYAVEYAVMTLLITLAYAGALVGAERFAGTALRESSFVLVVFVVTVAFAFDPLRRRVQVLIDRTFFRNRPDHRRTLRDVSEALVTIVDLPTVVARVGWSLATAVVAEHVAIGFWSADGTPLGWSSDPKAPAHEPSAVLRARVSADPHPVEREPLAAALGARNVALAAEMDRLGAVLTLPLMLSGGAIGYVALGPKRSGRPYERDDLELLGTMANQAAIAMQNASSYQLLQTLNRQLEAKVVARTEELQISHDELADAYGRLQDTQGQLIQSEKMASLGQLVAGVAHELNNPLTFIVGNIAPLREQLAAIRTLAARASDARTLAICDDMAQILAVIASGAERTATIVKDLRSFSRVDEGTAAVVDLREGLRITINLLRPRWKDRVTIDTALDGMPRVECDAGQMNQVFMNVLSNACDAIPTVGNVWIEATSDGDTVAVAIRDDGDGIAPAHLSRIFDPFFTTKQVGQGTGLGLSIAHGIVQKHGGRITVTSEVGVGTQVVVHLPIREPRRSVA